MNIRFTRRGHRCQLRCSRTDGSVTSADLAANLPYHDLAHYVVERRWCLERGFYGNMARGRTVAELSGPDVIRGLGPQSLQAEVLTRGVQSVVSGACAAAQFAELVNTELAHWHAPLVAAPVAQVEAVVGEFKELCAKYRALSEGESLSLEFEQTDDQTHEHAHTTATAGHLHRPVQR
jgi:hypothetical protein